MKHRRMVAMLMVIALLSLGYVSWEFVNKVMPGYGTESSDATTSATTEPGAEGTPRSTAPESNAVTSATPSGAPATPGAAPGTDAVTSATSSSSGQTTGAPGTPDTVTSPTPTAAPPAQPGTPAPDTVTGPTPNPAPTPNPTPGPAPDTTTGPTPKPAPSPSPSPDPAPRPEPPEKPEPPKPPEPPDVEKDSTGLLNAIAPALALLTAPQWLERHIDGTWFECPVASAMRSLEGSVVATVQRLRAEAVLKTTSRR